MLTQSQVIDLLNEHFVCIEWDATERGPMPVDKYPAMRQIREASWDHTPWSRVSYGAQWIIEPGGEFLLAGWKRPRARFRYGIARGLKRFIELRSHEPGSADEAEYIEQLRTTILAKELYSFSAIERTNDLLGTGFELETRVTGIFEQQEPEVRRQAAEHLGLWAVRESSTKMVPSGEYHFLGDGVAKWLDDESPAVRAAAATALFQFQGADVPDLEGDALVEAARKSWAALPKKA